jgi:hypothetical protein
MTSPTSRNSEHCEAALDLAQADYSVFPCRARAKAPLTAHGFNDATRDERTVLQWWDRWPDANPAVACGESDVSVVDVDTKHGASPTVILPLLADLSPGRSLTVSWTGSRLRRARSIRTRSGARSARTSGTRGRGAPGGCNGRAWSCAATAPT